ncbi:MAG: dihydrodipicolinate synthase family protein, partial [Lentisphaeria bacterium]
PAEMSMLCQAMLNNDLTTALQLHRKFYNFFRDEFIETNPIPIKAAMAMKGWIKEEYRLPICELAAANREKLQNTMKQCGIL